jgi:hypothetical protein
MYKGKASESAAPEKFNSASIRAPLHRQRLKGDAPNNIGGLKRPEVSLETL